MNASYTIIFVVQIYLLIVHFITCQAVLLFISKEDTAMCIIQSVRTDVVGHGEKLKVILLLTDHDRGRLLGNRIESTESFNLCTMELCLVNKVRNLPLSVFKQTIVTGISSH